MSACTCVIIPICFLHNYGFKESGQQHAAHTSWEDMPVKDKVETEVAHCLNTCCSLSNILVTPPVFVAWSNEEACWTRRNVYTKEGRGREGAAFWSWKYRSGRCGRSYPRNPSKTQTGKAKASPNKRLWKRRLQRKLLQRRKRPPRKQ